jgi:fructose-bisphosphate aldolase, class II
MDMDIRSILQESEQKKIAIGHFNISDSVALHAIVAVARKLNVPVFIGTSEGEAGFIGYKQAAALVKSMREEFNHPIFLNADHSHSIETVKQAVEAGYDSIIFDGSKLLLEDNIKATKYAVEFIKSKNPDILVEGELGYIGSSSVLLDDIPEGAAIEEKDLTTIEEATRFVQETKVDLFSPAVGNLHGMFKHISNPRLNIERIKQIKETITIPMVLHGGSGIQDEDFVAAIEAGVNVIHINTEIRRAWRAGLEARLQEKPDEVAPYKLLDGSLEKISEVVYNRLTLFSRQ